MQHNYGSNKQKIPQTRKHNSFIKEDRIMPKKLQNQNIKNLSFILSGMGLGCGIHIDQEYKNKGYLREGHKIKLLINLTTNSALTLSKTTVIIHHVVSTIRKSGVCFVEGFSLQVIAKIANLFYVQDSLRASPECKCFPNHGPCEEGK